MAGEEIVKEKAAEAAATVDAAAEAGKEAAQEAAQQTQEAAESIQSSMDSAAEGASEAFDGLSPAAESAGSTGETLDLLADLTVSSVYLMGSSFILGVLFTVFVLLVLDFMRRNSNSEQK